MSTGVSLAEWLRAMGLPNINAKSLQSICNPSTCLIWEQLIANAIAKQKVEYITKNLIINRLNKKPLDQQRDFPHAIKEIDTYLKKESLGTSKTVYEGSVRQADNLNEDILVRNKKRYVLINCLKENIQEYKRKAHLLHRKYELIHDDLNYVESLIKFLDDKSLSTENTEEDLEACMEKLLHILHKTREPDKMLNLKSLMMSSSSFMSATSSSSFKNRSTFKYFSKTESKIDRLYEDMDKENKTLNTSVFLDSSSTFDDVFLADDSFMTQKNASKCHQLSTSSLSKKTSDSKLSSLLEKFHNNVGNNCRDLLSTKNKNAITTSCRRIREKSLTKLHQLCIHFPKQQSATVSDEETLFELYYTHVKNELEAKGFKSLVQHLKNSIKSFYGSQYSPSPANDKLKLMMEEIKLDAALKLVTKYTLSANMLKTALDFRGIQSKINQTGIEMTGKINDIEEFIGNVYSIMSSIQDKKRDAIGRINHIIWNESFAASLTDEVFSQEIELFKEHSLAFNHDYRNENTSLSHFPSYADWNPHNIQSIVSLLECPFRPVENILINHFQTNIKCQRLRSLQGFNPKLPQIDYPSEDIEKSNESLHRIQCELSERLDSSAVRRTLSCSKKMQEVTELWLNLPFGKYISEDRLVDGHDYKFYEKKFDRLSHDL